MKFVVDRKTWYRGQGGCGSRLLRRDGMRCCLGHVGKQLGISDESLSDATYPSFLVERSDYPEWMRSAPIGNASYRMGVRNDMDDAARINDSMDLTDEQRESKLKEIFARHGDELEFIN